MPTRRIRNEGPRPRRFCDLAIATITTALAASCVLEPAEAGTFAQAGAESSGSPWVGCSKRNILLILMEDVGIDELPSYYRYYNGNARRDDDIVVTSDTPFYRPRIFSDEIVATPSGSVCLASAAPHHSSTIERLAAAGVTFLNAWADPSGSPTTAIAEALSARGYVSDRFGQLGPSESTRDAIAWIHEQTRHWMATVSYSAGPMEQRATVETLDSSIKTLLEGIPPRALSYTTVILIGDNGKGTLSESGIHVPFIIADGYTYVRAKEALLPPFNGKGHVAAPGRHETGLVQTRDIFATIADIACADEPDAIDSISLVPMLSKPGAAVRAASFAQSSPCRSDAKIELGLIEPMKSIYPDCAE